MNLFKSYLSNLNEEESDDSKLVKLVLSGQQENVEIFLMILEGKGYNPVDFVKEHLGVYLKILNNNMSKDWYYTDEGFLEKELIEDLVRIGSSIRNKTEIRFLGLNDTLPNLELFSSLEHLYFDSCYFDNLNVNIPNLETLDVRNSDFIIDEKILKKVEKLILKDSSLESHGLTDESFNLMSNTIKLDLINMKLITIPSGIYEMPKLIILNLIENENLGYLDTSKMNHDYMPLLKTVYINDTDLKYEDDILEHLYNQGYIAGY